jgi:hypothetical protein
VEGVKRILILFAFATIATTLGANTCLPVKNPVPTAVVCGHVFDPLGESVPNVELQLLRDKDVVSSVITDEHGNFMFPPVPRGDYGLTANSDTWHLYWPVRVTSSKQAKVCKHPLEAKLSIGSCGSGISKKGYHAKF